MIRDEIKGVQSKVANCMPLNRRDCGIASECIAIVMSLLDAPITERHEWAVVDHDNGAFKSKRVVNEDEHLRAECLFMGRDAAHIASLHNLWVRAYRAFPTIDGLEESRK